MVNQITIEFIMRVLQEERTKRALSTVLKQTGRLRNARGQFITQSKAIQIGIKHETTRIAKNAEAAANAAQDRLMDYRLEGRGVALLKFKKEEYTRQLQIEEDTHRKLIQTIGEEKFANADYTAGLEQKIRKQVTANIATMESVQANRMNRQALMQASISMFVMNISIGQAVGTYTELLGLSEEWNDEMREAALVMQAVLAPLQVMSSFMMIQAATATSRLATATLGLTGAVMGTYFAYKAVTAESSKTRALYAVLTGITYGLTAAHIALSWSKWKVATASVAAGAASSAGMLTPQTLAAIAMGTAAVIGTAIYAMASLQTVPGQFWQVQKTGAAIVDEGEIVGRPSMGGVTININGSVSDGYSTGQEIARALRDEGLATSEGIGGF